MAIGVPNVLAGGRVSSVGEVEMARYPLTSQRSELFVDRNFPRGKGPFARVQREMSGSPWVRARRVARIDRSEGCARVSYLLQKSIGSIWPREARSAYFTRFEQTAGTGA